jgi:excisionase family DNA binding protein
MTFDKQATPRLLLTPREAAETLSISERKLWEITASSSGELPCVRIGRCKRYRVDTLEAYLDAQEQGGAK